MASSRLPISPKKNISSDLDATITFRLPSEDRDALKADADKRFLKMGDVLREMVREWMKENKR